MVKILLGKSNDLNERDDFVYWEPQKEHNPHLLISGCSGSGKTVTLRTISSELKKEGIPILVFDFHDDFTDFAKNIVNEDNLKIHPLALIKGERPKHVAHRVSSILKHSFYDLTAVQEGTIRKAILKFYEDCGIGDLSKPIDYIPKLKPFREFINYFEQVSLNNSTIESIKIKLDILFDYEVFSESDETSIDFGELLKQNTVFQLKHAPSDNVKKIVAELMISKLIQYCYQKEQTKEMRLYCIIDEAHRMVYQGSPLDQLFRESRKYGVGVILASQRATDFNELLLSQAGTVITMKQNLKKDANYIERNNFGKGERLMNSRPGEGFLKFSNTKRYPIELKINYVAKE